MIVEVVRVNVGRVLGCFLGGESGGMGGAEVGAVAGEREGPSEPACRFPGVPSCSLGASVAIAKGCGRMTGLAPCGLLSRTTSKGVAKRR